MATTKIGIITYNFPHLKTEQVILGLLRNASYTPHLKIYALPFVERKKRETLINHRPNQVEAVVPQEIAYKHQFEFITCKDDTEIDNLCDLYIIAGAGIISAECLKDKKIINCHPGIIPAARGLDSFKWSILNMKPLGVTLHYIDPQVDEGEIISIVPTEIYRTDSILTLARRHYENEIYTLSNYEYFIENPTNPYANIEKEEAKRRMPVSLERDLLHKFHEYVERYGKR